MPVLKLLWRCAAILEQHALFATGRLQGQTARAVRAARRYAAQQLAERSLSNLFQT